MQSCEGVVSDHQQYSDVYNETVEWLNDVREKLTMCSDVSGDRHSVQGRLDKIQVRTASWFEQNICIEHSNFVFKALLLKYIYARGSIFIATVTALLKL